MGEHNETTDAIDEPLEPECDFNKLDEKFVLNEVVGGLIAIAVIVIVSATVFLGLWFFRGIDWICFTTLGVAAFLILLTAFGSFIWPKWFYRNACWKLDDESFEIRKGVFWKHRVLVPLGRVQHADVSQGPLQRYFGLGKLVVYTAGSYQASVELDGLSHASALQLRDRLIQQTNLSSELNS